VTCAWALLYIERWLTAPMQQEDGSLVGRSRGTPQGGVISPILANLFMHYAFDLWMARNTPTCAGAGMQMTGWCTAGLRRRPFVYAKRLRIA
jgi:retron-type reverse transcriptase